MNPKQIDNITIYESGGRHPEVRIRRRERRTYYPYPASYRRLLLAMLNIRR